MRTLSHTAAQQAAPSAMGKASHTKEAAPGSRERAQARGSTTRIIRRNEMSREDRPLPSAWQTPCKMMLAPAKKKPQMMMRRAVTHSYTASPEREKQPTICRAKHCSSKMPQPMITDTVMRPQRMASRMRSFSCAP